MVHQRVNQSNQKEDKVKIKYVSKAKAEKLRLYLESYPNAGPNPNVAGMKKLFWGENAYCLKSGSFVYHVPIDIWDRV